MAGKMAPRGSQGARAGPGTQDLSHTSAELGGRTSKKMGLGYEAQGPPQVAQLLREQNILTQEPAGSLGIQTIAGRKSVWSTLGKLRTVRKSASPFPVSREALQSDG